MEILQYIQLHTAEWIFAGISLALGYTCRLLRKKLQDTESKNEAIAEGIQSLLRESIVGNFNKYQEREYCPIYAKESIKRVYTAYHKLGGNDVATKLYEKLLEMPEEKGEFHESNKLESSSKK